MRQAASYWIRKLKLKTHPEGGHYRETYRSADRIPAKGLPRPFGGSRAFSTAIYFLLAGDDRSKLHRLKSDEFWQFYRGSALILHVIGKNGILSRIRLGPDPERGDVLQGVVPAGSWFGARLARPGGFALVGCTVAPGFDFRDFELGDRETLLRLFPKHRNVIEELA